MTEIVAQRYEDEIEAETAASLLRANGVKARVSYRATMGAPRGVVPIRVVAPVGVYELLVPESDATTAADLLDGSGAPSARPMRYRWLGVVLLTVFFGPIVLQFLASLIDLLR